MALPLLTTKLYFPQARLNLVPRPRLVERLNAGLLGPLTLVSAPAGYGKTTLLSEWRAGAGKDFPAAWLSLDAGDNDPQRFFTYFLAALEMLQGGQTGTTAPLVHAPQPPPPEILLTSLANDLNALPHDAALILDDYHAVTSRAVHEAIGFLLDQPQPRLHLVILTRSDPQLPLARLRARNQLVEIRAADLRFTPHEAAAFLNEAMGLRLSTSDITVMENRTEGWIAGLQMAALSMQGRGDVSGFIRAFSGSNRFILDYLAEEVVSQQPEHIQRFLLHTSKLKRLSGPLCDAVTGQSGSQEILEQIEKANLFLVPLDDERRWYRYHHLFASLLGTRLDQLEPRIVPQLHLRAAAWLEKEGMAVEAINHALAAGEHDGAARMVEENTTRLLAQGQLTALMGWIEALPAELRRARPWLCVHQAYALAFAGRLDEIESLLAQAEAAFGQAAESDGRLLAGAVAAVRAMAAVMGGRDAEAVDSARRARELLPEDRLWDRAAAAWALGYATRSLGDLVEARAAFEEQIRLGRAMGNIWTLVTGLTDLAHALRNQGHLGRARELLEEALDEAGKQGSRSLGYIARMESSLAAVLYEQNELDTAARLLADAIAHTRLWPNPNHMAYAYVFQARVQLARGDLQSARESIGEALAIKNSRTLVRMNQRLIETDLVRLWLALRSSGGGLPPGDPLAAQARALVEDWQADPPASNAPVDEGAAAVIFALARVRLAAGNPGDAAALLEPFTARAREAGHAGVLIPALVLAAVARQGLPGAQIQTALAALEEALSLAEPGGFARVFLDEGRAVQQLLGQWMARAGTHPLRDYAARLLAFFDAAAAAEPEVQTAAGESLREPLSQRELEVLHLMAQGRTNQEIAHQLVLALGTVKAHTASIYRKLDAVNRTEATTRARELGILP